MDEGSSMSAENVRVVRRWFEEVWNERRSETVEELLTPDSVCYGDDGPIRGPEEFRQKMLAPFLAAFHDIHVKVEDAIGQGDQVVVRWSAKASHCGDGLGCPPTHRPVEFRGLTWAEVKNGKLVQGWQSSNIPEVLQSLMH
jgi:predicted ester cyclase